MQVLQVKSRSTFDPDRIIPEIIEVLRSHGRWLSRIEERLEKLENTLAGRRTSRPAGDPPCIVCGRYSDDILCEKHRKYKWMR